MLRLIASLAAFCGILAGVRFVADRGVYRTGDEAVFPRALACRMVDSGAAVFVRPRDKRRYDRAGGRK